MKTLKTEQVLIGCVIGCVHRLPNKIEVDERYHERLHERYKVVCTIPQCAKINDRCEYRSNIYNRADEVQNQAIKDGKTWKTAQKYWNEIADEYRHNQCPFYECSN